MFNNPVTPALELLLKRMEAGELKPRQFELVARELMWTAIFAYRTRPTPEEEDLPMAERNLWTFRFEASALPVYPYPTMDYNGSVTKSRSD